MTTVFIITEGLRAHMLQVPRPRAKRKVLPNLLRAARRIAVRCKGGTLSASAARKMFMLSREPGLM